MSDKAVMPNVQTHGQDEQGVIMAKETKRQLEADICVHIFSVSAALVGICLTVIGLIQVIISTKKMSTLVDDFLAADAVLFLISCWLSYWALRTRSLYRMYRVERVADIVFLLGLTLMVLACSLLAYAIW